MLVLFYHILRLLIKIALVQQPKMAKNRIDSNSLEPLKQQDAINDYRQSGQSNDLRTYENFKQKRKY